MWFLAIAIAILEFIRLRPFPDPTGADGYFYLKQIQALSSGTIYYKDYSLAFLPPALLNAVLGNPLLSYQIAISLTLALTGWITYRLVIALAQPKSLSLRFVAALAVGLMMIGMTSLDLQWIFMKTAVADLCFLVAIERASRGSWCVATLFAALAILCHKLMAVLVPIFFLFWFIEKIHWPRPRVLIVTCLSLGAVAVAVIGLHPELVSHLQSLMSRWHYPHFAAESFEQYRNESCMLILSLIAALLVLFSSPLLRSWRWACAVILLLPLITPGGLRIQDLTYRLLQVALPFICIAVTSGFLISFKNRSRFGFRLLSLLAVSAFAVLSVFDQPSMSRWVIPWAERIPNPERLAVQVPLDSLVYAPHGLEFYLAYRTPFRPRSFPGRSEKKRHIPSGLCRPYLQDPGALHDDIEELTVAVIGPEFRVFHEDDWQSINRIHQMPPISINVLERKPDFVADYE